MPKVIDNIRGRAISEAREILIREGYAALLEDWQELTNDFAELHAGHPAEQVVEDLFSLIQTFTRRYDPAWREYEQKGGSRSMVLQYHGMLAEQFAGYIRKALPSGQQEREPYLARFLAEITIRFGSDVSMTYGVYDSLISGSKYFICFPEYFSC